MTEDKKKEKIKIKIDDEEREATYRTFKSGKKGYGCYGIVKINGYPFRISMNLIEI